MPEPLLEVRALDAHYGDFQALFGITMGVAEGEVVAVIGANGAGKSTLLKCIAGAMAARRDAIVFAGTPIGDLPAHEVVARGIALVPEGRRLFPSLTVEENLLVGGQLAAPVPGRSSTSTTSSPCWPSARSSRARRSPAASSRWSPSDAR
jgi:branched-chain amino acid transport system ATP-binding protein